MAETTAATATASADRPTATLYWLEQSRAQRIVWLLEECKGLSYNLEVFKRQPDKLAPPELRKIHPLGKSPLVGLKPSANSEPIILAESGFITEYLAEHFAKHLVPKKWKDGQEGKVGGETEQWLRYAYYLQFAEGSLMALLIIGVFVNQIRNAPVPFFIRPITRTIASRVDDAFLTENYKRTFGFLNSQLETSPEGGDYLCGKDLTAVDILMSFPIMSAATRLGLKDYPKLQAYADRLENHPGFKNSVKKVEEITGEPFSTNF